jgi:hypothetical protein
MKKWILCLGVCFLFQQVKSQTDLKVIATTGGTFESKDLQVSWTLGESVISTLEKPGAVLTQGFHQPTYDLVAVGPVLADPGIVEIYPSPFTDLINIDLHFKQTTQGLVSVTDMTGKLYRSLPFNAKAIALSFITSDLPCGQYIITTSGKTFLSSSSIIKIQ